MSTLYEGRHPGEFIASEDIGTRSRDVITIASGAGKVSGCTVLGKKTIGTATVQNLTTGQDTIAAPTVGAGAKVGKYSLVCLVAGATGKFELTDPTGVVIGLATVGTQFVGGGLTFTITDVGTHAVVGDEYTITVAAGSGKWLPLAAAGGVADGTDTPAGILYADVDATSADQTAVAVVRACEVNASRLLWGAAATATGAAVGTLQESIGSVTCSAGVLVGVYKAVCTLGGATGTFNVIDPTGLVIGVATVGIAFSGGGLAFTISDGGTHAVIGDTFNITVIAPTANIAALTALGVIVRNSA